jgi:hypothetical protein
MKNSSPKRMTIRFFSQEALELLEKIPNGIKSLVIETALIEYTETENGKRLIEKLSCRNKKKLLFSKKPVLD